MTLRGLILFMLFIPLPVVSALAQEPDMDSRIKAIRYDENDVYTITTKFGYQTNIVFDRGESIDTISVGDRSMWQIIPAGNRLFIRPMQEGASTNMTLLTNKRSYQFDLKSLGPDDKDGAIYVAKFLYGPTLPPPPMPVPPPMPPIAAPMPPPAPPVPPPASTPASAVYTNYNYTYSGPDALAPLQVFDNGDTTFLKYLELPAPLPQVYMIAADGTRTAVTPTTNGNLMAVNTVVDVLSLEHPNGTITVYNEMPNLQK